MPKKPHKKPLMHSILSRAQASHMWIMLVHLCHSVWHRNLLQSLMRAWNGWRKENEPLTGHPLWARPCWYFCIQSQLMNCPITPCNWDCYNTAPNFANKETETLKLSAYLIFIVSGLSLRVFCLFVLLLRKTKSDSWASVCWENTKWCSN